MSDWVLIYEGFDPTRERQRETLCTLGNGYFATRGAAHEANADSTHYPGTYLAGGYNRLQTEIEGRTIENEDLVNLPNWLVLTFRHPGEAWFNLTDVELLSYRQTLDLKAGVLHRSYQYQDRQGRKTTVSSRRFVHLGLPHLAGLEVVITPDNWSGPLEIHTGLDGRVRNTGVARYAGSEQRSTSLPLGRPPRSAKTGSFCARRPVNRKSASPKPPARGSFPMPPGHTCPGTWCRTGTISARTVRFP